MRTRAQVVYGVRSDRMPRRGVTLVEVLVAIFVMGIGLLALLTLFPVGALELAQAINDDRAGKVASDAAIFSEESKKVLEQTRSFVTKTLLTRKVDSNAAEFLRSECQKLSLRAEDLETRLRALRPLITEPPTHRLLDSLLVQINAIRQSFDSLTCLLRILEDRE